MIRDIVAVTATRDYHLHLEFEDGVTGEVDVEELVDLEGVFAPLRDRGEFLKVYVDRETGTVAWPNGADLDPVVLYAKVSGRTIEELLSRDAEGAR